MSIEITDEKKREAMDALGRALDVAMYQTLAASVPACGAFGAIAQDLDFAFPILTAALSPAPQALAGEAREDGIDTLLADRLGPWAASAGDDQREAAAADLDALLAAGWLPPSHAREQAERIERLEAALRWYANLPEDWEIITTTGGRMGDLQLLGGKARAALADGGRDNG